MSGELLEKCQEEIVMLNNLDVSHSNFENNLEDEFFDISSIVIPFSSFITKSSEDILLDRNHPEFKRILLEEFRARKEYH